MSKKILVDADVLIELFLDRSKFKECFDKFAEIRADQQYKLYATSKCLKRISDECGEARSNQVRDDVIGRENIIFIHKDITDKACNSSLVDFDSAEELICATESNLDAILTLTPQNFDGADLEIISLPALTGKEPKSGDKLRKHPAEVIFGSLALLSIGIYLIKHISDGIDIKIVPLTYQDMKSVCLQEFRNKYQGKNLTDDNIDLQIDSSRKEAIPAHRWTCIYTFKDESTSPIGRPSTDRLGLDLKDSCQQKFFNKYRDQYKDPKNYRDKYKDLVDARFLHFDNPYSISCVLLK